MKNPCKNVLEPKNDQLKKVCSEGKNYFLFIFQKVLDKFNFICYNNSIQKANPLFYKGFTLIELLILVLIIGILAAVALPQYQVAVEKTRLGVMMPNIKAAKNALEQYYLANGHYPVNTLEDIDFDVNGCWVSSEKRVVSCRDGSYYQYNTNSLVHAVTAKLTVYTVYLDHGTDANQQPNCRALKNSPVGNRVCRSLSGVEGSTSGDWIIYPL